MYAKKEKQIELACEFLTQQMNHWMLFPLIITAMGCMSEFVNIDKPDILMWFCGGILPILTFLVRGKIKRFIPFTLCNLCILSLTLVIPADNIVCRTLCVICGVGYFIHTFILRIKTDSMFTTPFSPAVGFGFSVFGIFFLHHTSDKQWNSYYVFSLVGCLALYMIIYYLNHYLDFLTVNESSSGSIPASEMFHSGMELVLGYTLTGTMILLLATNLTWLERILGILKKALIIILRFFFSLFSGSEPEEELFEEAGMSLGSSDAMNLPPGESSRFWEILETVCIAAFTCVMVFAVIRLILFIIRFLKERFHLNFRQRKWDVTENTAPDIREKCALAKDKNSAKRQDRFFGFLSPGERVRKLYKKKLLRSSNELVNGENGNLALYTARESEKRLGTIGMAEIYEKVRYSNINATVGDVKRMRDACRQSEE